MNKNIKVPAVVGFILYAVAAFFSIAILTVFFDYCGLDSVHGTWIWQFGKLFTGVYGVCSVLIPAFLLVAAFECFMQNWRVRNGVVLAGSVIPFFTLDAIEHIFRMLIAENSGDSLIMKLMIAALTGGVIVAIEFLVLSILGDAVEGSVKKTTAKEGKAKKESAVDGADEVFDIKSILNSEDEEKEENAGKDDEDDEIEAVEENPETVVVPEDNPFAHIFDEQDKVEEEAVEEAKSAVVEENATEAADETDKPAGADTTGATYTTDTTNETDATNESDSTPKTDAQSDEFEQSEPFEQNAYFEQSEPVAQKAQFARSDEKTVLSDEQAWNNWGAQTEDAESLNVRKSEIEDEKAWENWKTDDENEELSDWNESDQDLPEESIADVNTEEADAEEEIAEDVTLPGDNADDAVCTADAVRATDDAVCTADVAEITDSAVGTDTADENTEIELPDLTDAFLNEEIEDFPDSRSFAPNTDFDDLEDDFADENEDAIAQEAQENYEDFAEKDNSCFDGADYSVTDNDFIDADFEEEEPVEAEDKKLNEARDYFSDDTIADTEGAITTDSSEDGFDSGDDGFGDEEAEDTPEGGDLSDFVEQRNSRFASIFAEMGRDAANSVKQAETASAAVSDVNTDDSFISDDAFGDDTFVSDADAENAFTGLPETEEDDFDTTFGDEGTDPDSAELADTQSFDGYEFDPTAEPVVDSNGMPFNKKAEPEVSVPGAQRQFQMRATAKTEVKKEPPKLRIANYNIPVEGILQKYDNDEYWVVDAETKKKANDLMQTLAEFNIEVKVTGIRKGPVVTMFEVLPAPGVNVNKIRNLQDNIALRLAATSVRIVSPIPGKSAVGIEIPNKTRAVVSFREIIEQKNQAFDKMAIPVILGKDISGEPRIIDLAKTPHLLIAGSTGSGKSVCVNSLILSILYKRNPNLVKLILIDPKVVELKLYNDIPHLLTPVITEPKKALQSLQYCICEMERRYALLDNMGVRDVLSYNRRIEERKLMQEKLPYIVIIIDEFADLMATTGKELESNVSRLAAMSRAVGIHLVLATQRPSVNVITGLIKANIPSRIAFMVASRTDSNIIIDQIGAEKLLGKGDMLYASATDPFPVRIQGTLVSDDEVEKVVEYVKQYGEPDYIDDEIFVEDEDENEGAPGLFSDGDDPLYDQALEIVVQSGKASASYLQRRLKIGYNRAARLVEEMEERGIVGPQNGSKPREVIYVP